jgi:hypothetical protein
MRRTLPIATHTRLVTLLATTPMVRAIVEVALVVAALALTAWLTINVWHTGDYDVFEYQQYAKAFWLDQPRFTAFPTEYPPFALLPFSLTLLPGFADPRVSFALALSVLFLAGYASVWRFVGRGAARRYAWYLLLALQSTLLARYDLIPALAVLAALLAARGRRFIPAYTLLAVGILLKLYPLVLLPVLMIEQVRATDRIGMSQPGDIPSKRHGLQAASVVPRPFMAGSVVPFRLRAVWARVRPALGGGALCVGLGAAGFFVPLLRNPSGALSFLRYATDRPIQVESFPATLLWFTSFAGVPLIHTYAFSSDVYVSPLSAAVTTGLAVAMVVGCLAVYALQLAGRLTIERAMLAGVALVLLGSKVFSTQYVTWALPLAAVAGGDTLVWIAICLLTFTDYPLLYPFNQPPYTELEERAFMALVGLRNVLLLWVTGRALLGSARGRAGKRTVMADGDGAGVLEPAAATVARKG